MKKISILFFVLGISLQAQQNIDISKGYTTIVFFNSDIVEIPRLANDVDFIVKKISDRAIELNIFRASETTLGTNCTVNCADGKLYVFNLNVQPKTSSTVIRADPKLAFDFIEKEEEISDLESINKSPVKDLKALDIASETEYKKVVYNCENNQNRKKRVYTTPSKSNNVILTLRDIAYKNDKLYMFFDINNKGGQSYEVEWVNINTTTKLGENGSSQMKILTPYYIHNQPKNIKGRSKYKFIVVLEKTAINQKKQVSIDIKELSGDRNLILNIDDEIINNPIEL